MRCSGSRIPVLVSSRSPVSIPRPICVRRGSSLRAAETPATRTPPPRLSGAPSHASGERWAIGSDSSTFPTWCSNSTIRSIAAIAWNSCCANWGRRGMTDLGAALRRGVVGSGAGPAARLGEPPPSAGGAGVVIVVDHHKSTTGEFGDILVVDPTAAASGQLTVALLDALGWDIDATTALCLLTGIGTDTGGFQYSSTSGEVVRIAARLLDVGVAPEVIGQAVFESVAGCF